MGTATVETMTLWLLLPYFDVVTVIVDGMLGLSYVLGQRHQDQATTEISGRAIEAGTKRRVK